MNGRRLLVAALVAVLGIVVAVESLFVVRTDQFAIVIQFGAAVRVIDAPGLYAKTPFVQVVHHLDRRIQSWDDQAQEVVTLDKKRIYISSFARWSIVDPLQFYTAVREEAAAQMNLDKIIGGNIREVVSAQILDSLVRDTDRTLTYVSEETERSETITSMPAGGGRTKMLSRVFELSAPELRETFGIGLIDVDIKHLNYTESAQAATIRQMISEREKVAARYEAEGRREARTLQGQTEELVSRLRGESTRERLQLEGLAEAESARLRSLAYGADPELYAYMKQLEVIQAGLSEGTRFVLSADTPLLSLLEDPSAQAPAVPPNPANIEALMKEVETTANIPLLVDPEAENLEK